MFKQFGIDLFIQNNDIVIGNNGDLFCTDDAEREVGNTLFDGYICLRQSIQHVIEPIQGGFSPHNVDDGANANDLISSFNFDEKFVDFEQRAITQLSKDDRISLVESITYEKIDDKNVKIIIKVIPNGEQKISTFVFPFSQS